MRPRSKLGISPAIVAVIALVVGLAVGAGVVALIVPAPAPEATTITETVTQTVTGPARTVTVTQTVTAPTEPMEMMEEEVVVKIWTIGPDPPSEYRFKNFLIVADILNNRLAAAGSPIRVRVEGEFFVRPVEWGEYKNKFYLAAEAGEAPHIYLTGHEDVGFLAERGFIIPLDDYIQKYWDQVYYDVIPTLWESVKFKGRIWAVPQDTEVRPMYFRKDILRRMGWSEAEINALPERVKNAEVLLDDLLEISKEAKDQGLIRWGILHRVKEGYDYLQFYLAFGGRLWDPDQGKMVFTKSAWLKMFQWFKRAVWELGVINPNQFSGDWDRDFHGPFTGGEALFLSGGSWHKGEWISKGLLTEDEFWENIGYMLHPAGEPGRKPLTLSHPLIYTVTRQAVEDGVADIAFELITMVTDPHLNSIHAVQSAHLAILYSQISDSRYAEDRFLQDVAYMLDFTTFIPNHPQWGDYSRIIFTTLKAVESDRTVTPEQALDIMLQQVQRELGEAIIIEE